MFVFKNKKKHFSHQTTVWKFWFSGGTLRIVDGPTDPVSCAIQRFPRLHRFHFLFRVLPSRLETTESRWSRNRNTVGRWSTSFPISDLNVLVYVFLKDCVIPFVFVSTPREDPGGSPLRPVRISSLSPQNLVATSYHGFPKTDCLW